MPIKRNPSISTAQSSAPMQAQVAAAARGRGHHSPNSILDDPLSLPRFHELDRTSFARLFTQLRAGLILMETGWFSPHCAH
jgi:hypothetical protein